MSSKRFEEVKNLYVLPFTSKIAPYMAAADVIMGKAGPNVLFESVVLDKPFLATTCLPGQEEGNFAFLQRHGLCQVALQLDEQCALITALARSQGARRAQTVTRKAYGEWNRAANRIIVPVVRSLLAQDIFQRVGIAW